MKAFKLQEITAMKFQCMKTTQVHLDQALKDGHTHEVEACRKELQLLKHEAMNPQSVADSINQYMVGE